MERHMFLHYLWFCKVGSVPCSNGQIVSKELIIVHLRPILDRTRVVYNETVSIHIISGDCYKMTVIDGSSEPGYVGAYWTSLANFLLTKSNDHSVGNSPAEANIRQYVAQMCRDITLARDVRSRTAHAAV